MECVGVFAPPSASPGATWARGPLRPAVKQCQEVLGLVVPLQDELNAALPRLGNPQQPVRVNAGAPELQDRELPQNIELLRSRSSTMAQALARLGGRLGNTLGGEEGAKADGVKLVKAADGASAPAEIVADYNIGAGTGEAHHFVGPGGCSACPSYQSRIQELEGDCSRLRAHVAELSRASTRITCLEEERSRLRIQSAESRGPSSQSAWLEEECSRLRREVSALQAGSGHSQDLEREVAHLRAHASTLQRSMPELQGEVQWLRAHVADLQGQASRAGALEGENAKLRGRIAEIDGPNSYVADLHQQCAVLRARIAELVAEQVHYAGFEEERGRLRARVAELEDSVVPPSQLQEQCLQLHRRMQELDTKARRAQELEGQKDALMRRVAELESPAQQASELQRVCDQLSAQVCDLQARQACADAERDGADGGEGPQGSRPKVFERPPPHMLQFYQQKCAELLRENVTQAEQLRALECTVRELAGQELIEEPVELPLDPIEDPDR